MLWYQHVPETVLDSKDVRTYWGRDYSADNTIIHNNPYIVLVGNRNKTTYLADITIQNANTIIYKMVHCKNKELSVFNSRNSQLATNT